MFVTLTSAIVASIAGWALDDKFAAIKVTGRTVANVVATIILSTQFLLTDFMNNLAQTPGRG